jgi:hypothetical protein
MDLSPVGKTVLLLIAVLTAVVLVAPVAQVRVEGPSWGQGEWSGVSTLGAVTQLGQTGGITESGYKLQFRDYCSKPETECYFSVVGVPLWIPY